MKQQSFSAQKGAHSASAYSYLPFMLAIGYTGAALAVHEERVGAAENAALGS